MTSSEAIAILHSSVGIIVRVAAPLLLVSMVIGILVSVFQAATQIHEQTLTFVPKLVVIGIILLAAGGWMLRTLAEFTQRIFDMMLG